MEDASTHEPVPMDTAYIKILEPKTGANLKVNETIKIITESDYDKFGQNLTFDATPDSGKTWDAFIISLELKSGMNVLDTVEWKPVDGGFAAGQTTQLRVWEYGKKHYAYTGVLHIVD